MQMQQDDTDTDPWALQALLQSPTEDTDSLLSIATIEDVVPLDDQFGVHPPKTVPDALYEPLFGQPEPTDAEIEAAGGDPDHVPPMQTYAILDAAKVFALAETLEASGLEHRCLFKGEAYDELKDVAPWIVRLEEGNEFARHLFTAGDAPWFLWDKEPGIYVRSRGSLDDIWRHFRKFTQVQDENDKWYYFRFWEVELYSFLTLSNRQYDMSTFLEVMSASISMTFLFPILSDRRFMAATVNQSKPRKVSLSMIGGIILDYGIWRIAKGIWNERPQATRQNLTMPLFCDECLLFCNKHGFTNTVPVTYICKALLICSPEQILAEYGKRLPAKSVSAQKIHSKSIELFSRHKDFIP